MSKRSPPISPEDKKLFIDALDGTKPIVHDKVNLRQQRTPSTRRNKPTTHYTQASFAIETLPMVSGETHLEFARNGINQKQITCLRNSQFHLHARLDLHGLKVPEAEAVLIDFLRIALESHKQYVRIVHGQGLGSNRDAPPLKNKVNSVLQSHPDVLAFTSTPPKDGGLGAVNVLLKLKTIAEKD